MRRSDRQASPNQCTATPADAMHPSARSIRQIRATLPTAARRWSPNRPSRGSPPPVVEYAEIPAHTDVAKLVQPFPGRGQQYQLMVNLAAYKGGGGELAALTPAQIDQAARVLRRRC